MSIFLYATRYPCTSLYACTVHPYLPVHASVNYHKCTPTYPCRPLCRKPSIPLCTPVYHVYPYANMYIIPFHPYLHLPHVPLCSSCIPAYPHTPTYPDARLRSMQLGCNQPSGRYAYVPQLLLLLLMITYGIMIIIIIDIIIIIISSIIVIIINLFWLGQRRDGGLVRAQRPRSVLGRYGCHGGPLSRLIITSIYYHCYHCDY